MKLNLNTDIHFGESEYLLPLIINYCNLVSAILSFQSNHDGVITASLDSRFCPATINLKVESSSILLENEFKNYIKPFLY